MTTPPTISMAPRDYVDRYRREVARVIRALGHDPGATLVTDQSKLSDFGHPRDGMAWVHLRDAAEMALHMDLYPRDYVWQVAQRIRSRTARRWAGAVEAVAWVVASVGLCGAAIGYVPLMAGSVAALVVVPAVHKRIRVWGGI